MNKLLTPQLETRPSVLREWLMAGPRRRLVGGGRIRVANKRMRTATAADPCCCPIDDCPLFPGELSSGQLNVSVDGPCPYVDPPVLFSVDVIPSTSYCPPSGACGQVWLGLWEYPGAPDWVAQLGTNHNPDGTTRVFFSLGSTSGLICYSETFEDGDGTIICNPSGVELPWTSATSGCSPTLCPGTNVTIT